jgi:hypothetical protein
MSVGHNPRCAIFQESPSLRMASDCNCGAIPPLPRANPSIALAEVISRLNLRKVNLDHIYDRDVATNEVVTRGDELDHVLELLKQVRS